MPTMAEQATIDTVNKKLQDPGWASLITDTCQKLNSGFYDENVVRFIMQKWRGEYTLYDTYAFLVVWGWWNTGWLGVVDVLIGCTPFADEKVDVNNAVLSALAPPFSGSFWGGNQDEDGVIKVSEPLRMTHTISVLDMSWEEHIQCPSFALEVGYTYSWITMLRLQSRIGLARWPYDSEIMRLFHLHEPGQHKKDFRYPPGPKQLRLTMGLSDP